MRRILRVGAFVLSCIAILNVGAENASGNAGSTVVTIRGFYDAPEAMQDDETIAIDGRSQGEFVEIRIDGTIYDLSLVALKWDDDTEGLIEDEILHHYPRLRDAIVVISTYLPEGIPVERITWKDASGDEYEYNLAAGTQDGDSRLQEFRVD